jgi:AbrB family looped-hinge helix DNA binding protein
MAIDTKRRNQSNEAADVTISSKRQITIPAAMARELGLEPGGKLVARLEEGSLVLTPRPKDWLEYITGGPTGVYGRTKDEVDAYIREVRQGWDERARIAEGDSYVAPDDPRFDP